MPPRSNSDPSAQKMAEVIADGRADAGLNLIQAAILHRITEGKVRSAWVVVLPDGSELCEDDLTIGEAIRLQELAAADLAKDGPRAWMLISPALHLRDLAAAYTIALMRTGLDEAEALEQAFGANATKTLAALSTRLEEADPFDSSTPATTG